MAIRAQTNGLTVVFDSDMGHYRLDPYPDKENVESYYGNDEFYSGDNPHSPPDWFEKEAAEHRRRLWDPYFAYLVRLTANRARVLDYGAGFGWFVDYCRRNAKYNICAGVEPSLSAIRAGENVMGPLPIDSSIDELDFKMYKAIYLNLVLEHIANPGDFLRSLVSDNLYDGGRIVVVVPNEFNYLQLRLEYDGFISPVHVNYFTPPTLRGVMRNAGLKIVHESTTFPMELFVMAGINYFGNDSLGRKCHRLRLRWEKLLGWRVFQVYKKLYDRWGIGRELIFVGEKT